MDVKKQEEIPERVYKRRRRRRIDRISELPDSLLHHILSFIPIKQVVTTSILSKRWKYLWTSLPILNFKLQQFSNSTDKFINFVDRFFLGHDTNIQKFSLEVCFDEVDEACVEEWISKVMRCKVQELKLLISLDFSEYIFAFSPNILTCESLVKLEIDGHFVLNLPTSTQFSNLKILRLVGVMLYDDYATQQFFSNCQALEELILDNCHWKYLKSFCISGPSLKRIEIDVDGEDRDDFLFVDCVIKIYAPNLEHLKYICCLPKDFILSKCSSLIDADICLVTESERRSDEELGYCATKFLGKLSNVKCLDISAETLKIISNAKDLKTHLPTFHNLVFLQVSLNLHHLGGRALFDLLQISPNLKYLFFAGELVAADKDCWIFEEVPQCVLLHLKEVSFLNFVGDETDFYVLKFLLNNARVLERMFVSSSYSTSEDLKKKLEIANQLLVLPRASTNCVLEFD